MNMKTNLVIAVVVAFLVAVIAALSSMSIYNRQIRLQKLYEAKLTSNQAEFSNLRTKLPEMASVTDAQMRKLQDLFVAHAEARGGEGGSLMRWIQESVPSVDQTTFTNLQNAIAGTRDSWTARQRELVDISRQYNTFLEVQPSGFVLSVFGDFEPITPRVVTTAETQEAFETGTERPMDLFLR